jgi:hypothetical protein
MPAFSTKLGIMYKQPYINAVLQTKRSVVGSIKISCYILELNKHLFCAYFLPKKQWLS